MTKKEKRECRINVIENAGAMLLELDPFSELSDEELDQHKIIGALMTNYPERILRLINRLEKENK